MSDEYLNEEEEATLDPNIRAELRNSRAAKKEAEQARAELENLKRELAFTQAGIPATGVGALLRKAYDGDTDPDAIRKAAAEYGILNESPQHDNPIQEELNQHRAIAGATGTNNSGPTNEQLFKAGIDQASNVEETLAAIRANGPETGVHIVGYQ
jgi:hypothetical protein